ncbi:MAG: hypothetical protein ACRESG_04830, partial [Gammaproteobacteria bacterium]
MKPRIRQNPPPISHLCLLAALLSAMLAAPAMAAVKIDVHVVGVEGRIKDNVLATLSIAEYKKFGAHPA